MSIKDKILECFSNIGVLVDENDNFLLSDVIDDSLMFVSMIVEIEQAFDIEIPDEYLLPERLSSFHDLELLVTKLMDSKS